eukprot:5008119-Pleurochrysis_carterae.AAC.1
MIDVAYGDVCVPGRAGEGWRHDEGRETEKRAAPEVPRGTRKVNSPAAFGGRLPRAAGGVTLRAGRVVGEESRAQEARRRVSPGSKARATAYASAAARKARLNRMERSEAQGQLSGDVNRFAATGAGTAARAVVVQACASRATAQVTCRRRDPKLAQPGPCRGARRRCRCPACTRPRCGVAVPSCRATGMPGRRGRKKSSALALVEEPPVPRDAERVLGPLLEVVSVVRRRDIAG